MQGKVSMVVPCYNKAKYISAMLDSVIAQVWDNIELILVNDGSTDGTREVIAEYESKLKARGYEIVIIDQENAGCCTAVYTGLIRMTGDYFCLVDCDDAIEPKYVSRMAEWLDTHDDCEWTACSFRTITLIGGTVVKGPLAEYKYHPDTDNLLEKYILRETITTVWIYMSRVSYIRCCGLIDNFCTERRKTYEPLIMVPLAHGKGKLEFFNEPLYRYNQTSIDLFRFDKFDKCIQYYDDYLYLYDWAISRLYASEYEKQRLKSIAQLAYHRELSMIMSRVPDGKDYESKVANALSKEVDELFEPAPRIAPEKIVKFQFSRIFKALVSNILGEKPASLPVSHRIIGYGALGKSAAKMIPLLNDTELQPTDLWDKNGDGVTVKKPDFDSLTAEDTILIFPTTVAVLIEVQSELEGNPAKALYRPDIEEYISELLFPQFKSIKLK